MVKILIKINFLFGTFFFKLRRSLFAYLLKNIVILRKNLQIEIISH